MKRRSVLLVAVLAATLVPLLSLPAASSQGGVAALGNHDISIKKLGGTNTTVLDGPGPYVMDNGHTAKFTNNTLNQVKVFSFNAADAEIDSKVLNPGDNYTFTQGVDASEISYFIVQDNTKNQLRAAVIYGKFPGISAPGLALLALLLTGAGAWALTRKRGQAAA